MNEELRATGSRPLGVGDEAPERAEAGLEQEAGRALRVASDGVSDTSARATRSCSSQQSSQTLPWSRNAITRP